MDNYLEFCKRCIWGKWDTAKIFIYYSDNYNDNNPKEQSTDISIVNPTQAAVDQAKSEVKNEKKTINRAKKKENIIRWEVAVERESRPRVRKRWSPWCSDTPKRFLSFIEIYLFLCLQK